MELYAIRRPNAWKTVEEVQGIGAKALKVGNEQMSDRVRWIRSYVVQESDGTFGSICIYQARDPESIREHAKRVGMPGDLITPVVDTIIIREDPAKESKAA
jgi:Nickel responsive protein SCO4226-like